MSFLASKVQQMQRKNSNEVRNNVRNITGEKVNMIAYLNVNGNENMNVNVNAYVGTRKRNVVLGFRRKRCRREV